MHTENYKETKKWGRRGWECHSVSGAWLPRAGAQLTSSSTRAQEQAPGAGNGVERRERLSDRCQKHRGEGAPGSTAQEGSWCFQQPLRYSRRTKRQEFEVYKDRINV